MANKAGIKHIEFWTSHLKRSIEFYKNIFTIIGWEQVGDNAFSATGTKIYFVEQPVNSQKSVGPRHVCFLAESREVVDQVAKFLTDNQADIIRGPIGSTYQDRSFYTVDFRDPDGYVIEVATKSVSAGSK